MIRALLAILVMASCGNSSGEADAGPPADARFLVDAVVQVCSADMDMCAEQAFATRCDLARSRCVECLSSEDCALPPSFGPTCDAEQGACQCDSDADCLGNAFGRYCHPSVKACGCITDDECSEPSECKLEPYLGTGVRTCRQP